jgi:N6-adenosine-specific RNA methylase IME4
LEDVKQVHDLAEAMRQYAEVHALGIEASNHAVEIKLRAERLMGQMLANIRKHPGGRPSDKTPIHVGRGFVEPAPLTLRDIGISYKQSARCQVLARIPEPIFEASLAKTKAEGGELTSAALVRLAKTLASPATHAEVADADHGTVIVDDLQARVDGGLRYSTIYADPPWPYKNQATRAATRHHYATLSLKALAALPVHALVTDNAHLHLWTTNAFLDEAIDLLRAWGFAYQTSFVWVKPQLGLGNYWRNATDLMLFGLRGRLPFRDHRIRNWIEEKRGRHSAKPEQVRTLIERVSPGPYLELFGRRVVPGWTVVGNQIDGTL